MTKNLDQDGLRSIAEKYDLFYIDLWGVVHNGISLYENAIKAINEISNIIRGKHLFKDKNELEDNMFNYLNQTRKEEFIQTNYSFVDEKILIDDIDYYYSNVIAKNSKTMSECRSLHSKFNKTGTDG
mgnify:CR=1 FL=1